MEAVRKLCAPVEVDERPVSGLLDIGEAAQRIEALLQQVRKELSAVDEDIVFRHAEAKRHLALLSIDSEQPLTSAIDLVLARLSRTQRVIDVCEELRQFLDLPPSMDLMSLHTSLEAAVLGAEAVHSAVQSDANSETRLKSLKEQLDQLMKRLSRIRGALERLSRAQRVLDDIIENQSLDAASEAVVATIHMVADSIFSRIHSPAEYWVTADARAL